MNKKYLQICGAILLLPALAGLSKAQVREGFEFGFYAGASQADGGGVQVIDQRRRRETRSSIDDGALAGFRAAWNFNRFVAIEGSVGGTTNNHIVTLFDQGSDVSVEDTTSIFFGHFNGVVHLAKGRFVPFVTAGGGAIAFVDQASPAINYGAGFKLFVSDRVALRLDFRQYHTRLKGSIEQVDATSQGQLFEISERFEDRLRFRELSAGITFYLRKK